MLEKGDKTLKIDLSAEYIEALDDSDDLEIYGCLEVRNDLSLVNYSDLDLGNGKIISIDQNIAKSFSREVFNKFILYYS